MESLDGDLIILAFALGVILYGVFSKTKVAGYEVTPPPQKVDTSADPIYLPGVSRELMEACAEAVDVDGGALAGPTSHKGIEPDRIKRLLDEIVIPRIKAYTKATGSQFEVTCTTVSGATCRVDSEGSEQYEIIWMMYEKFTATMVQMVSGVLVLDDGRILVTACRPYSEPPVQKTCTGIAPAPSGAVEYASYELPISPEI